MEQNIQILRMANGEELIANVEYAKTSLIVHKALGIGIDQQAQRLVFVPFMPYTDASERFEIEKHHVAFVSTPQESLINDYIHATTPAPRIISPSNNLVTPFNTKGKK